MFMENNKPVSRSARRISALLDKVVSFLCAIVFGAMTIDVLLGVFFRYVLNSPLNFTEELARYLMIWGASLAISLGVSAGEHVGLTIILDSMKKPNARKALAILVNFFVFAFLVFMSIYSAAATIEAKSQMTQSLGISMFLPKLAVPLAMILAAIQIILVSIMILADKNGRLTTSTTGYIDI
jgi:TRAP-type C4-dicarboxylate transport system permease small subunit